MGQADLMGQATFPDLMGQATFPLLIRRFNGTGYFSVADTGGEGFNGTGYFSVADTGDGG